MKPNVLGILQNSKKTTFGSPLGSVRTIQPDGPPCTYLEERGGTTQVKFRAVSRVAPRPLGPDVLRLPALRGHDVEDVRRQQERVDGIAD